MPFNTDGLLYKVFDTETKGANDFKARDFVIKEEGQYPNFIKFQLNQSNCEIIDNIPVGSEVSVTFDLKGRETEKGYFTNLIAWKIVPIKLARPASAPVDPDAPF